MMSEPSFLLLVTLGFVVGAGVDAAGSAEGGLAGMSAAGVGSSGFASSADVVDGDFASGFEPPHATQMEPIARTKKRTVRRIGHLRRADVAHSPHESRTFA